MNILLLLVGLSLIVLGAQFLVDGSSAIAKKLRMPEFLIGLTIVGIGTSMPEMVVSLFGTLEGHGSIAIGNVIGSNTANVLLILGVSALVRPIPVNKETLRFDLPLNILMTILLIFFCFGTNIFGTSPGVVTRVEGIILLAIFAAYMFWSFHSAKRNPEEFVAAETPEKPKKAIPMWLAIVMVMSGLAGLIFGGRLFVSNGIGIARMIGISEGVIAITLMAVGTSLPEMATSVVAAAKGKTDLALGNIIGSNISNIGLIIGTCATVAPLETTGIMRIDVYMTLLTALLLVAAVYTFRRNSMDRWDGALFLAIYITYMYLLTTR